MKLQIILSLQLLILLIGCSQNAATNPEAAPLLTSPINSNPVEALTPKPTQTGMSVASTNTKTPLVSLPPPPTITARPTITRIPLPTPLPEITCETVIDISQLECEGLFTLYVSAEKTTTLPDWFRTSTACEWEGIHCESSTVVSLTLGNKLPGGFIPDGIGDLTQLRILDLSDNQLHGEIPNEIVNLLHLVELDLSTNRLSGSIPEAIGDLAHLGTLDLSNNQLHGEIPDTLENLRYGYITIIDLSNNNLHGLVSVALQNLPSINYEGNVDLVTARPIDEGASVQKKNVHEINLADTYNVQLVTDNHRAYYAFATRKDTGTNYVLTIDPQTEFKVQEAVLNFNIAETHQILQAVYYDGFLYTVVKHRETGANNVFKVDPNTGQHQALSLINHDVSTISVCNNSLYISVMVSADYFGESPQFWFLGENGQPKKLADTYLTLIDEHEDACFFQKSERLGILSDSYELWRVNEQEVYLLFEVDSLSSSTNKVYSLGDDRYILSAYFSTLDDRFALEPSLITGDGDSFQLSGIKGWEILGVGDDTIYTRFPIPTSHNTGPVFDKFYAYDHWGNEKPLFVEDMRMDALGMVNDRLVYSAIVYEGFLPDESGENDHRFSPPTLFATDGQVIQPLLENISGCQGTYWFNPPQAHVFFDGYLYFCGKTNGVPSLVRTDGTAIGTQWVIEGLVSNIQVVDDWLYFLREDENGIAQVWLSNGTQVGTTQLTNFSYLEATSLGGSISQRFGDFIAVDDSVYFTYVVEHSYDEQTNRIAESIVALESPTDELFACELVTDVVLEDCQELIQLNDDFGASEAGSAFRRHQPFTSGRFNSANRWFEGNEICSWEGVQCEDSRVVEIDLPSFPYQGTLPSIDRFPRLKTLNLSAGCKRPEDIAPCVYPVMVDDFESWVSRISDASKQHREFQTLSTEYGAFLQLEHLNFSRHYLRGNIPGMLIEMAPNLRELDLSETFVSGSLPIELIESNVTQLKVPSYVCIPPSDKFVEWAKGKVVSEEPLEICDARLIVNETDTFSGCNEPAIDVPIHECEALVTFYNATNGLDWVIQTNWLRTPKICSWYGIFCENQRVTKIELDTKGTGGINPNVGEEYHNDIIFVSGILPGSLGVLSELKELIIQPLCCPNLFGGVVTLGGELPKSWGNLSKLEKLEIGNYTLISGCVPTLWKNMTSLETLYIHVDTTCFPDDQEFRDWWQLGGDDYIIQSGLPG